MPAPSPFVNKTGADKRRQANKFKRRKGRVGSPSDPDALGAVIMEFVPVNPTTRTRHMSGQDFMRMMHNRKKRNPSRGM